MLQLVRDIVREAGNFLPTMNVLNRYDIRWQFACFRNL